MRKNNQTNPFLVSVYSDIEQVSQVQGVSTNMEGHIAWGTKSGGKTTGSLFVGDYMGS